MKRVRKSREERTIKLLLLTAIINLLVALVKLVESLIQSP